MTVSITDADLVEVIEIATWVGGIVSIIVVALVFYLLVRPPRRAKVRQVESDPSEVEEMIRLIERMEARLEVLERTVEPEPEHRRPALKVVEQVSEIEKGEVK
jgi:hypothetical protein